MRGCGSSASSGMRLGDNRTASPWVRDPITAAGLADRAGLQVGRWLAGSLAPLFGPVAGPVVPSGIAGCGGAFIRGGEPETAHLEHRIEARRCIQGRTQRPSRRMAEV